MRVVVIGAGLAGLAAACHLTGRGYEVTVVEREDIPGGRNGQLVRDGFTFDTGPTVLTMRDLVADALRAVDADLDELLPMRRLDPAYRAQFADGSTIRVRYGREAMRNEIADTCGSVDAAAFDGFVDWLQDLYVAEMPHFIDRNFDSPLDLLSRPDVAAKLVRLGGFGRLGNAIRRRFTRRPAAPAVQLPGHVRRSGPRRGPGHLRRDHLHGQHRGRLVPRRGHARDAGRAGHRRGEGGHPVPLRRLGRRRCSGARTPAGVAGVRLDSGEQLAADAVVCTLDLPTAYEKLLPDLSPPRSLRRPRYSPSAVVWHVGVRGLPDPEVSHHNIHFGQEWGGAFDDLLKRGTLMGDASRLVTIPSLDDPSLAPEGCSTLFVLEPVPNLADGKIDWVHERGPMRERLLAFLAAEGYPTDIVTEELVTPLDWQAQGMAAGTPFALAHTFAQTGPFRPANVERRVPGLVFSGSGTVPGVGVPMVLISGKLSADRVDEYLGGGTAGRTISRRSIRRLAR